jgi:hypothetical protein
MSEFIKIQVSSVADLIKHMDFTDEGSSQFVVPSDHPAITIDKLTKADLNVDAVRLLAHALPKREAVWWACLAVRQCLIEEGSLESRAIAASEAWVRTPTEEYRQHCRNFGEQLQYKTPASWVAMAAAWSTGSLTDKDSPEVAPPEYLYAHAVGGAINLAAVVGDPEDLQKRYAKFIAQGFDLARGGNGNI